MAGNVFIFSEVNT